ncbi:MAG: hypothetical protein EX269_07140 [Acidimicrobiales bacterium]|nr:MAG: hypothetical protein EX269_07140 [Acidimicrobiales bacterium]
MVSDRIRRFARFSLLIVLIIALASACASEERREIRIAPTASAEPAVRAIVDNCPGPSRIILAVRTEVLWQVDAPESTEDDPNEAKGLREFIIGQTPTGWTLTEPLTAPLNDETRYTILTQPDGDAIDFDLRNLEPGLLFDGEDTTQFNDDLFEVECSEPPDVDGFVRNVAVLGALWITTAALAMVGIILLLFVITRRFSRIRSIQKKSGTL